MKHKNSYCPKCGGRMQSRERRPNGNDTCVNGHEYRSADCVYPIPQRNEDGSFVTDKDGLVVFGPPRTVKPTHNTEAKVTHRR